jgi:hypothetical protein
LAILQIPPIVAKFTQYLAFHQIDYEETTQYIHIRHAVGYHCLPAGGAVGGAGDWSEAIRSRVHSSG